MAAGTTKSGGTYGTGYRLERANNWNHFHDRASHIAWLDLDKKQVTRQIIYHKNCIMNKDYIVYMKTQALFTKELATMYFANCSPRSATTQLRRWIKRNQSLKNELTETGYKEGQRVFTPRQVELVFRHLGEP